MLTVSSGSWKARQGSGHMENQKKGGGHLKRMIYGFLILTKMFSLNLEAQVRAELAVEFSETYCFLA